MRGGHFRHGHGESRYRREGEQSNNKSSGDYRVEERSYRNHRVHRQEGRERYDLKRREQRDPRSRREEKSRKRFRDDVDVGNESSSKRQDSRADKYRSSKRPRRQNPWDNWQARSSSSEIKNTNRVLMIETDPRRLSQRQKQIDYGKNTIGYDNYIKAVPKKKRRGYKYNEPNTPDKQEKYSMRQWRGINNAWRRCLHNYDNIFPSGPKRKDGDDHSKTVLDRKDTDGKKKKEEDDDVGEVTLNDKELEEFENDDLL